MQRSSKFDATFLTTHSGQHLGRTAAGLVAVAIVGVAPWASGAALAAPAPSAGPQVAPPPPPAPELTPEEREAQAKAKAEAEAKAKAEAEAAEQKRREEEAKAAAEAQAAEQSRLEAEAKAAAEAQAAEQARLEAEAKAAAEAAARAKAEAEAKAKAEIERRAADAREARAASERAAAAAEAAMKAKMAAEQAKSAEAKKAADAQVAAADAAKAQADAELAAAERAMSVDTLRAQARDAMAAQDWRKAVGFWSSVLAQNPGDSEAKVGLARSQSGADRGPLINDTEQDMLLQRGRVRVEFGALVSAANQAMSKGDFVAAEDSARRAAEQLTKGRMLFSTADFDAMSAQVESLLDEIEVGRNAAELAAEDASRRESSAASADRQRAENEKRRAAINERLLRVRQLQAELKYEDAIRICDEILALDPNDPAAQALRAVLKSSQIYREYSENENRRSEAYTQFSQDIHERTVPPMRNIGGPGPRSVSGILEYPEDWPQLSDARMRSRAQGYSESAVNRQSMAKLQKAVSVNFSNNTLDQVFSYMSQVTEVEFYPDWKALESIGVDQSETVDLTLSNVPGEVALKRVLESLGDEDTRPDFSIEDGVVFVSSDEQLRKKTFLVVYDIRDLLFEVPMFDNAPDFNLSSALNQGNQGGNQGGGSGGGGGGFGGGGGGGGGGFGGGGGGAGGGGGIIGEPGEDPERRDREELIQEIKDIIIQQVDKPGWDDEGGTTGFIQELNGNLIITNTARNHRDIEGLLTQLRAIRALQINYEARVIGVTSDWFEQIGVDLDVYFNTNDDMFQAARGADPNFNLSDFFFQSGNSQGQLKDPVIFGGFEAGTDPADPQNTPATGAAVGIPDGNGGIQYVFGPVGSPIRRQEGWTPVGFAQDSTGIIASQIGSLTEFGVTVASGPAAAVTGFSYMDDIQVDLLIKATQADKRNVALTAPRLTLMNGQRSFITIAKQISFISGLTPVAGDASGAFQPQVGVVQDGFVLDVEGVISADRRYVTMTVQFDTSTLLELVPQEVQGAVGGTGTGGGRAGEFAATIQLPQILVQSIRTTVSVPDKGTILLGGQRRFQEVEVESGVPVLSKIPIVNRFFTNRLDAENELTTVVLMRPEIVIQSENEEILFPGIMDQLNNIGG